MSKPDTTVPLRYRGRRILLQYTFENGGQMSVTVDGDVATEDALWAIRELMTHKQNELAKPPIEETPDNGPSDPWQTSGP